MRMPTWFQASRVSGVPVHWTPVSWQGWVVVAALTAGMLGATVQWAATAPGRLVGAVSGLVAATIAVAALTDGDGPGEDGR